MVEEVRRRRGEGRLVESFEGEVEGREQWRTGGVEEVEKQESGGNGGGVLEKGVRGRRGKRRGGALT